LQGL